MVVDSQFQNVGIGIDSSGVSGSLTVIDSSGSSLSTFVFGRKSSSAGNSIILDNVQNSGKTVTLDGDVVLNGSVWETWVYGNLVSCDVPMTLFLFRKMKYLTLCTACSTDQEIPALNMRMEKG